MKALLCLTALLAMSVTAAGVEILDSGPGGITLSLETPAPVFGLTHLSGSSYATISLEGAENLAQKGLPRLPVYRLWIEVPIDAEVRASVTVIRAETLDVPGGSPFEPGLPSVPKSEPRDSYVLEFDPSVYVEGQAWPREWVRVIDAGMMRGRHLALVEVLPVRWSPSTRTVDMLSRAEIRLDFEGGDLARTFSEADRMAADGFERLLAATVENYGTFESFDGSDSPMGTYLVIAHPDFYATAMSEFVTWKTRSGWPVTMVSTAETGGTAEQIEAYIINALQNWPEPPQYVLLVGDTGFIPGNTATEYSGVTDLYYVCLPDGGWMPDAFIGRFSVQTAGQAVLMAQRLVEYEQWDYSGSGAWMQSTGWIASSDNSSISEGTHNYCIDTYCTPLGYTADKLYPATYGSTAADVVAAVNEGESMLTFSGHGSQTSWGDMAFGSSNFNQLNNEGMFPGVISHACLTGEYATGTCWAETWTRTPGRGGLWFWGSVPSTYWGEDDIQERGEYDYFLGQDIFWSMGFLNGGKLALYAYYSGGGSVKYYFEGYNLMGDPSAEMWTWVPAGGIPMTMNVSHPSSISGTGPVTVTVAGASDDAIVCLWKGDEVYERGWTSGGSATFYVEPETTGTILVTVRRHDYKPYLGSITVNGTGSGEGPGGTVPLSISCPNPVTSGGALTVTGSGAVSVEVFDLSGRVVARPFQGEIEGTMQVGIDTGELASGVYFARAVSGSETASARLTVIR